MTRPTPKPRTFLDIGERTVLQFDGQVARDQAVAQAERHLRQQIHKARRQLMRIDGWRWSVYRDQTRLAGDPSKDGD